MDENLKEAVIEDAKPCNVEEQVKEQLEAAHTKVVIEDLVSTMVLVWTKKLYETNVLN